MSPLPARCGSTEVEGLVEEEDIRVRLGPLLLHVGLALRSGLVLQDGTIVLVLFLSGRQPAHEAHPVGLLVLFVSIFQINYAFFPQFKCFGNQ